MSLFLQIAVALLMLVIALPHANRATRAVPGLQRFAIWLVGCSGGVWLIELLGGGRSAFGPWLAIFSVALMLAVDRRGARRHLDDLLRWRIRL